MYINLSTYAISYWRTAIRIGLLLCMLLCHSTPLTVKAQARTTTSSLPTLKQTSQSVENEVARGAALLDAGKYDEAIAAFNQALAIDANHARAYALRGQAYWLKDELEHALADLDRALELAEDADAYGTRGAVYTALHRYPEAIDDFDLALRLAPDNAWTLAQRGYAYYLSDDFDAALLDLNQAIRLNPQYVWAIIVRGTTYNGRADYAKALLDLTRALSLEPDNDWALATRGSTYRALGEYRKAIADLNRALTLNPTYQWAMAERGQTYQEMGDNTKALADFTIVIEQDPTYAWALAQRGMIYFDTAQYEAALADFNKAIESDPTYDWAFAKRGQTYQAQEEYEAALADFTAAIAIDPTYGWYYAMRADLLRIMERYDEALDDANQAVDLTPDDEFGWAVRGYVYRMLEHYDEALADFTQAITIEPTYAWAYTMRGELYQLLAREEEALADFEQANRLNGVDPDDALAPTATPEPEATPTAAPAVVNAAAAATGDSEDAVEGLAAAQQAVIQIEAVGSFSSLQEEGPAVKAGRGTGFIIDPSGIAVTNNHVVTGGALFKVYVDGRAEALNARVLGVSECADLAVIDIEGDGFSYVSWYDSEITVGLDVYAAGYPLGDPEYTLTRGIIAKVRANGQTAWSSLDQVLQHDADINPGNSGGPLLTGQGQVVGVNYAVNAQFRQSFAIGPDQALPIIEQLRQGNDVDSLGINGEAVSDGADLHGIWISSVQSGSPADQAGIQGGDFILSLENIGMANDGTMQAYCEVVRSHSADDTLNVEVYRRASNELCSGQINGRTLTCQKVETAVTPAGEDTPAPANDDQANAEPAQPMEWQPITHTSGRFSLNIPAAWTEQESSTIDGREQLVVKSKTDSSAAVISLYLQQATALTFDDALDEIRQKLAVDAADLLATCTHQERDRFTNTQFTGAFEHWSACGTEQNHLFTVVMQPLVNQTYYLYWIILWNPTWETAGVTQMLDSLTVMQQVTVLVQSAILNFRSGPGTNYGTMGQLHGGTRLPVIAQANGCAWLQVQLPDNRQGWIAGRAPYATLEGDCAIIPQGTIPQAAAGGGGGSGGNGCILFQNHFNDEANVTLTSKDGRYNQTFKVGRKANYRHCVAPGGYTYTVDVPPPWGEINGELDIQRGRTITFPIYGN